MENNDYIKRGDAIKALFDLRKGFRHTKEICAVGDCIVEIKDYLPAVDDVVEVVRCEHCKFYRPYEEVEDFDGKCIIHGIEIDKDFYCQYGNKKTE